MNLRTRCGSFLLWPAALALVAAAAYGWRADGSAPAAATQDVSRVESRLNQLEQRFRSVEMSITRLEQQSRMSGVTPGATARDAEVSLLRSEVDALRRRLAEAECGLVRLDERTLTPTAREQRRKVNAGGTDPCRLEADAPLRLSTRP